MKTEITKLAAQNQLIDTPIQVVCVNYEDALGLRKSCAWSKDKSLRVDTSIEVDNATTRITHSLVEVADDEECNRNIITITEREYADSVTMMISDWWDSSEDDDMPSIVLRFSDVDQRTEVKNWLIEQLTAK